MPAKTIDFGYTGPWAYGHLTIALVLVPAAILAWRMHWKTWIRTILLVVAAWSAVSAAIVKFVFGMNDPIALPTEAFLKSSGGKVLDMGCGSGRATIMVLTARPGTMVTALDNWSADYIDHNSEARLLANAEAVGAAQRVQVATGDMRAMPFPDASFDGVVSTYAIDHLPREGTTKALSEAARVLRPGGEFLLAVMNGDGWTLFTFGPHFHGHSGDGVARWTRKVEDAGLTVIESGTRPWTVYILSRKGSTGAVEAAHERP
jgi:SAM-dependent methyltransferase